MGNSGHLRVTKNTLYNLIGQLSSFSISLITVPIYLREIGDARYGIIAITWLLLGYFGLFDLGMSYATNNMIARAKSNSIEECENIFWSALTFNLIFGAIGGVALYYAGAPILGQWIKMPIGLRPEIIKSMPWLALAVPTATASAVLFGAMEGKAYFATVNVLQTLGTSVFQVLPLLAAILISPKLNVVIPVAVLSRALMILPLFLVVKTKLPLQHTPKISFIRLRNMARYGIWITVSSVISPILSSVDQIIIGRILGASAVSHYAVPFNLVNRSKVLPLAASRALFPYLSSSDKTAAQRISLEATATLNILITPFFIIAMFTIKPFINLWLGNKFSSHAAPVGERLLIGMWINGLANVAYSAIQAQGRPDLVAKFHALEIIPFLILLLELLKMYGLEGAAMAWTLRVSFDAALLFWAAGIGVPALKSILPNAVILVISIICIRLESQYFHGMFYIGAIMVLLSIVIARNGYARLLKGLGNFLRFYRESSRSIDE